MLVEAGAETGDALHIHGDIANDLLENGAPLAAKDALGRTPLDIVARDGVNEIVRQQLLLCKGAG